MGPWVPGLLLQEGGRDSRQGPRARRLRGQPGAHHSRRGPRRRGDRQQPPRVSGGAPDERYFGDSGRPLRIGASDLSLGPLFRDEIILFYFLFFWKNTLTKKKKKKKKKS